MQQYAIVCHLSTNDSVMHIFMLCRLSWRHFCILPTIVGTFKNILQSPNSHAASVSLLWPLWSDCWFLVSSGLIWQWSCKWVQREEHPQAARYQASRSRADLRWLCQPGWRCPAVCLCSVCCAVWVHTTQISIHTTHLSSVKWVCAVVHLVLGVHCAHIKKPSVCVV